MKLHQLLQRTIIWDINDVTDAEITSCLMNDDDKMIIVRDIEDQVKLFEDNGK